MNRLLNILLATTLCLMSSCSLTDESINPGQVTDVTEIDLLQGTISQVARNQSTMAGRTAAGLMQYFVQGDANSVAVFNQYLFATSTHNNMWNDGFYAGSLTNIKQMKTMAQESSNDNIEAIANILMAHEFGTLTDFFGDIPLSESLEGYNNVTPVYDSQEDVYTAILSMLDHAIQQIESTGSDLSLSNDDILFSGNMKQWKELAYGLKARYLLNLSKRDPSGFSEILDIVSNKSFSFSSDQANFTFHPGNPNPYFQFGVERPSTFFIADYLRNELDGDPRYDNYIDVQSNYYYFTGGPDLTWTQENSNIPIFSFTELRFIEAEARFHLGEDNDAIRDAFSQALQSSFASTSGITVEALSYIDTAVDFQDLTQEQVHGRIMNEAYKAYYGYSHLQAWNNYRRTGYPQISSTANGPNTNNLSNIVPRRVLYPSSELELNSENVSSAINRQNGAKLDERMWLYK